MITPGDGWRNILCAEFPKGIERLVLGGSLKGTQVRIALLVGLLTFLLLFRHSNAIGNMQYTLVKIEVNQGDKFNTFFFRYVSRYQDVVKIIQYRDQ
jgi:hypothetical protein